MVSCRGSSLVGEEPGPSHTWDGTYVSRRSAKTGREVSDVSVRDVRHPSRTQSQEGEAQVRPFTEFWWDPLRTRRRGSRETRRVPAPRTRGPRSHRPSVVAGRRRPRPGVGSWLHGYLRVQAFCDRGTKYINELKFNPRGLGI